ncbi:UDP-glucose/GDP-mannose dehydrogenase family protein [Candidatus Deferrimicrobium sp.]|uniref:UDP-glucose dehydrogenase family protein n=1 Tax=Candidatus Deferrimicrobium sp. TaxID=3060586 RepID=UPI002ED5128C
MNVAIVGTGYVGLVTGVCLAERGNSVHCVDTNPSVLEKLNAGQVTIYEPGLEDIYLRNLKKGRISFSADLVKAVVPAEIIFLCLPTPPGEDGSADLKYILQVATDIGKIFARRPEAGYKVVVDKSTVPVGTSEKVRAAIRKQAGPAFEFDVVSNPEFLREGFAVEDFLRPERVVIGSIAERAILALKDLYEPFLQPGSKVIVMDEKSAEVTKYAANAFLALKISYMNDLANFCDAVGADIDRIRDGIGSDSRIGHKFLFPGLGYGGSCLPKDVKALLKSASDAGTPLSVLQAVEDINQEQRKRFFRKMAEHFGGKVEGRRFAVWGIAFKPNTDDTREAPVFHIVDELLKGKATVAVYDPEAMEGARLRYGDRIDYAESSYGALQGADALVIATEWNEFRKPDFGLMKTLMRQPVLFDGRNVFDPRKMRERGFLYHSIGRKAHEDHGTGATAEQGRS